MTRSAVATPSKTEDAHPGSDRGLYPSNTILNHEALMWLGAHLPC